MKKLTLAILSIILFVSVGCEKRELICVCNTGTQEQQLTTTIDDSFNNTIIDYQKVVDNDLDTYGYIAMSIYSKDYYGYLYLNLGDYREVSGYKFKYSFPNTTEGECHGYPGNIYRKVKANLYYHDGYTWVLLNESPTLLTEGPDCQVINTVEFNFDPVVTNNLKFEILGRYHLGGGFQTTTYYRAYELEIK